MMGDFEASISEGYLMCPIVHWLKVIGKFVYIILQLNKQIKNIGAHPNMRLILHQHNTKIRVLIYFSIIKKNF
jgi:hypothetical protein